MSRSGLLKASSLDRASAAPEMFGKSRLWAAEVCHTAEVAPGAVWV